MDPQLFYRFRDIAYAKAGIKLGDCKAALVSARVAKRLRVLGLSSPKDYLQILERDLNGKEVVAFIDAISTNYTSFFREPAHFEHLRQFLLLRIKEQRKRLRIWCAASSSGEEPYTIAMTCAEALEGTSIDWRILATDISTRILDAAERAVYPQSRLQDVPRALLVKYFRNVHDGNSNEPRFAVIGELRRKVLFKRLNLALTPYPMPGPIDIIFCRNVLIYFDHPVRQALVGEVDRLVADNGLVCVGHAESLNGLNTRLTPVVPSVYRPRHASMSFTPPASAERRQALGRP